MAVVEIELADLWDRVIEHVSLGEPQHRAFLTMTKPLGLIQSDGGITNLLVAAPNVFAKDVLESRLRVVVNEVLTRELGDKTNIAVMVDESLELADHPAPAVVVEAAPSRPGTGRDTSENSVRKNDEPSQLNPRYIFETFVIGASNRFAHAAAVAVAQAAGADCRARLERPGGADGALRAADLRVRGARAGLLRVCGVVQVGSAAAAHAVLPPPHSHAAPQLLLQ